MSEKYGAVGSFRCLSFLILISDSGFDVNAVLISGRVGLRLSLLDSLAGHFTEQNDCDGFTVKYRHNVLCLTSLYDSVLVNVAIRDL